MKETLADKTANRYTSIVAEIYRLTGCVLIPQQNADADLLIREAAIEDSDIKANALVIIELLELPKISVTVEG
jgi:hypothetical protein